MNTRRKIIKLIVLITVSVLILIAIPYIRHAKFYYYTLRTVTRSEHCFKEPKTFSDFEGPSLYILPSTVRIKGPKYLPVNNNYILSRKFIRYINCYDVDQPMIYNSSFILLEGNNNTQCFITEYQSKEDLDIALRNAPVEKEAGENMYYSIKNNRLYLFIIKGTTAIYIESDTKDMKEYKEMLSFFDSEEVLP